MEDFNEIEEIGSDYDDEDDYLKCEHCGGLFDAEEGYCGSCSDLKLNQRKLLPDEKLFKGVIEWQGIEIKIDQHRFFGDAGITGITVESVKPEKEPLPITETGFKSLHIPIDNVRHYGGAESYIIQYLDHEAAKPEWAKTQKRNVDEKIEQIKSEDAAKQIDLFGG